MVVTAAVLWSSSTVFMRLLQQPSPLCLESPAISPLQIAFYRSFFAGLCVLALMRPRHVTFKPLMGAMLVAFGIMTALYLSALGLGTAANAILLQNTAPVWIYFLGVYLLGDPPDRPTLRTLLLAMLGALIILAGNWPVNLDAAEQGVQQAILLMAAGSGFFYAIVVLFLRQLRNESAAWLTTLNLLGGSAVILGFAALHEECFEVGSWLAKPSGRQLVFLAVYGVVQLAVPYFLFAKGLKVISPQEAGIITLLEPLLNPLWAYLIAPDRETPTLWTFVGGAIMLAALAWRYWPRKTTPASS